MLMTETHLLKHNEQWNAIKRTATSDLVVYTVITLDSVGRGSVADNDSSYPQWQSLDNTLIALQTWTMHELYRDNAENVYWF